MKVVTGAAVLGLVGVGVFFGEAVEWTRVMTGLAVGPWIHGVGYAATLTLGGVTYRAWTR